jgi:hypothetical protein
LILMPVLKGDLNTLLVDNIISGIPVSENWIR